MIILSTFSSILGTLNLSAAGVSENANNIFGTSANDTIWGGSGKDYILGEAGNDFIGGNQDNDTIIGGEGHDTLFGWTGNDSLLGGTGDDLLSGEDGDDTIVGGTGNDALYGGNGNDVIRGDTGASTMFGGAGSDTIIGGTGNEIFYYARGDGDDVIRKASTATTNDVLELTNIASNQVTFSAVNNFSATSLGDLNSIKISINGGGSILLDQYLDGTNAGRIAGLRFSDGIVLNTAQIALAASAIIGTSANDTIWGGSGQDYILGEAGDDFIGGNQDNDTIIGGEGDDTLFGWTGNDSLHGGTGDDLLSGEDGDDTIVGGTGNDALYGGNGNDVIRGDTGASTMFGGAGADTIIGGNGNEIFYYARGDGDDVIRKASTATTNDVLELTNIASSEVTFSAVNNFSTALLSDPNSIRININGGGSILLEQYLDGTNAGRIASLRFSDGVVLSTAQIAGTVSSMNGTLANDTIIGGNGNDIINGYAGADSLNGAAGNDSLYGGTGADSLRGGLGNDMLQGGEDSDTYFYAKGDGNDVLVDFVYSPLQGVLRLENITRSEVSFAAVDMNADGATDSIRLNINSGGSITLQGQLNAFGGDFFNVVFSDGITMNADQIRGVTPIIGTFNNDTLFGDNANNNISGLGGNDQIIANAGNDSLSGDAGNDTIWGNDGNDVINGGEGLDHLVGGMGADNLNGGIENDSLWADDGNDTLTGGFGVDYLFGGNGADRFVFNRGDTGIGTNGDNIADFNRSQGDKIALLGYGLNASGFRGTGAMAAGGAVEFNYTKVAAFNYTMIRIDADNNGVSDQEIWLTGVQIDLVASDFVFV